MGRLFAAALDADDWAGAEALLADECVYAFRGGEMRGAAEIVGSYRKIGEWVARSFDAVRYESRVAPLEDVRVEIAFRDLIDHGEHHLDFRCKQRLRVDAEGRVVHIEHIDIEGEPEKAARFNAACGVTKPT